MNGKENIDYVVCQVCGFEGLSLNRHISSHNLNADKYAELYPDSRMTPKVIAERQADKIRGQRKPSRDLVCEYCGGRFNHRENLWQHLQKERDVYQNGTDGVEYLTCKICGMRTESLSGHIKCHGETRDSYLMKFPESKIVIDRVSDAQSASGESRKIETQDRSGATFCDKCGEWYLKRFNAKHLEECVSSHPDKYVEGKDYVRCPECSKAMTRLGEHLKEVHGWDDDRIVIETGRGLKLIAEKVVEKMAKLVDFNAAQVKREQTHLERHGHSNPFSDSATKEKIIETSQRRYGVNHPMQNEEVFIRHEDAARKGPSGQEIFFDEHTCDSVVYTGQGSRFIRTKTGVHKYGRIIKDLNPDFMILPDNVLESAQSAIRDGRPLDRQKHRTKYVIELLGDWYHSEQMIGVKPEDHEREIIAAYSSAGIKCLTLWEKDVMGRWNEIEPMVSAWIDKAVKDINEHPVWKKSTKTKADGRIGIFVCPNGSGKRFRTREKLERWMIDPLNFWRQDMAEGKDCVRCLECQNVRVGKIAEHLRQSHGGMTKEEYLAKHPGALTVAGRVGEIIGGRVGQRGSYVKRTAYRCPDGSIVGKKDAWLRAWGNMEPPKESIVDGSLFDPWAGKIEGQDFVVCSICGYKAANLARHLKREHGGVDYQGQIKSKKCVENLSAGANSSWDVRGRSPERDVSQNKTHKEHGLTEEKLRKSYVDNGLSDAKIGDGCGITGDGVAYLRKKFGIETRLRKKVVENLQSSL